MLIQYPGLQNGDFLACLCFITIDYCAQILRDFLQLKKKYIQIPDHR